MISLRIDKNNILYVTKCKKIKPDIVYFADSLGKLRNNNVINIVNLFSWKGPLGIHAHDNLEMALSNTITALNSGANWLDLQYLGWVEAQEMQKQNS